MNITAAGRYGVRVTCQSARPSPKYGVKGQWEERPTKDKPGRPYRGRAFNPIATSAALGGPESNELDDHLNCWGIPPVGRCYAVDVNAQGAKAAVAHVEATRKLTAAVDTERMACGRLDPIRLHSAGSFADGVLDLAGVRPPLAKAEAMTDDELRAWTACLRGGLSWAEDHGQSGQGADFDKSNAYACAAIELGQWGYSCAEELHEEDRTEEFRAFLAAPDLEARCQDPAVRRYWALTRSVLALRGEPMAVSVGQGDDEHLRFGPALADRLDCTWADAVLASIEAGHPVEVIEARKVVAVGHEDTEVVRLFGRPVKGDLIRWALGERRAAKARGETRRAAMLRLFLVSLVYGCPVRFDGARAEPGPRCFPPFSATVTALTRLDLRLARRKAEELGLRMPYADTDGGIVVGDDPAALRAYFDDLRRRSDGLIDWQEKSAGQAVNWGVKRYRITDTEGRVIARTEHTLGAYAAPPSLSGRADDGGYRWTLRTTAALGVNGEDPVPEELPFEPQDEGFPALIRNPVRHPYELEQLPPQVGARPFTHTVEASTSFGGAVALDPGGDLESWRRLDWYAFGRRVALTTLENDAPWMLVDDLRSVVERWVRPVERHASVDCLRIDPLLVRRKGPDGRAVELGDELVQRRSDDRAVLLEAGRRLGHERLAELTGLRASTISQWLYRERRPSRSKVVRAVSALQESIGRNWAGQLLDMAAEAAERSCAYPGCPLLARPLPSVTCSDRHRKALSRLRAQEASEAFLADHVDLVPGPRIGRCGHKLDGRQQKWCSEACRKRHERADRRPDPFTHLPSCERCGTILLGAAIKVHHCSRVAI